MPQTSVGTTGVVILPKNAYRRSAIFHNPSANIIFIETEKAISINVNTAGIRIPSLSTRTMNWFDDGARDVTDEWSAISDTGSNTLVWREFVGNGLTTEQIETALAKLQGR